MTNRTNDIQNTRPVWTKDLKGQTATRHKFYNTLQEQCIQNNYLPTRVILLLLFQLNFNSWSINVALIIFNLILKY